MNRIPKDKTQKSLSLRGIWFMKRESYGNYQPKEPIEKEDEKKIETVVVFRKYLKEKKKDERENG